jgi:hypothetical protein
MTGQSVTGIEKGYVGQGDIRFVGLNGAHSRQEERPNMDIRFMFQNWHTLCRTFVSQPRIISPTSCQSIFLRWDWAAVTHRRAYQGRTASGRKSSDGHALNPVQRKGPDWAAKHAAARIYFVRSDDGSCKEFRLFQRIAGPVRHWIP